MSFFEKFPRTCNKHSFTCLQLNYSNCRYERLPSEKRCVRVISHRIGEQRIQLLLSSKCDVKMLASPQRNKTFLIKTGKHFKINDSDNKKNYWNIYKSRVTVIDGRIALEFHKK